MNIFTLVCLVIALFLVMVTLLVVLFICFKELIKNKDIEYLPHVLLGTAVFIGAMGFIIYVIGGY